MARTIAIVEGKTEVEFVKATMPRPHVMTPFPNGKRTPVGHICEAIVDALEGFGGTNRDVVILVDREKRDETAVSIRDTILKAVSSKFPSMRFHIGVSDRHIENWIVADESFVKNTYNLPEYSYCGDGAFGDMTLHRLNSDVSIGAVDRARLLRAASAKNIAAVSPSFERFVRSIDFDWYWAKT